MFRRFKFWQRGQILVFTALLLPIIFLFFACAINAAMLYIEYTRLQNAADAAALAGATSYAKYCKEHRIGATILTQPLLQVGAEKEATDAMEAILKVNLPHGELNSGFRRDQIGEETANTHKVSLGFLGSFTVTDSYDYNYEVTSNVVLSETIPLIAYGEYPIEAKSKAVQPLFENRTATKLIINYRDYNIADSKLTK